MEELSKEEYYKLHTSNLRPLKISIEIDKFFEDIKTINFQQWGDLHLEFPRFAFALVNQDGVIKDDDPACYPLDRYNFIQEYPQYKMSALSDEHVLAWRRYYSSIKIDDVINETQFTKPTKYLSKNCFDVLDPLKPYMLRSCILRWDYLGHFKKHVDSFHPTKWLRLWGTTNPEKMVLRYEQDGAMIKENNIIAGKLYLHDSIRPHEALAFDDNVYQFFIALKIDSINTLNNLFQE